MITTRLYSELLKGQRVLWFCLKFMMENDTVGFVGDTPVVPDLFQRNIKKSTIKNQTKLPNNVLALYVKLYCRKKCAKSSKYTTNVIEATKSWITLSETEKVQFFKKYKECQRKHIQIIGNCLQKAEPYMKKRIRTGSHKTVFHGTSIEQESKIIDENQVKLETSDEQDNFIDTVEHKTEIDDHNQFYDEIDTFTVESEIENNIHPAHESSNIFNPEPTPPSIKTGKELFDIIKLIDNDNDSTWASLPNKEKCQHNRAVLTLKRDYILKYKQYLEHLTQRELFDHYNKNLH